MASVLDGNPSVDNMPTWADTREERQAFRAILRAADKIEAADTAARADGAYSAEERAAFEAAKTPLNRALQVLENGNLERAQTLIEKSRTATTAYEALVATPAVVTGPVTTPASTDTEVDEPEAPPAFVDTPEKLAIYDAVLAKADRLTGISARLAADGAISPEEQAGYETTVDALRAVVGAIAQGDLAGANTLLAAAETQVNTLAALIPAAPTAAEFATESAGVRTLFERSERLLGQVRKLSPKDEQAIRTADYLINVANEAASQGKLDEANTLLTSARGTIDTMVERGVKVATRRGETELAAKLERLSVRLDRPDLTPVTLTNVDVQAIVPQARTERLQDRLINLRNRSADDYRAGLDVGVVTDRQLNRITRLTERGESRLATGNISGGQDDLDMAARLLKQQRRIMDRNGDETPALSTREVVAAYNEASAIGGDNIGTAFLRAVLTEIAPDYAEQLASAPRPGGRDGYVMKPVAYADDQLSEMLETLDPDGLKAQMIQLYREQVGYTTTRSSGRNDWSTDHKGRDHNVDVLFDRVMRMIGGSKAVIGDDILVRTGDGGRIEGSAFNDSVTILGQPLRRLNISTGSGNDTVQSVAQTLVGGTINTQGGRDVVSLAGQIKDLDVNTGNEHDQIVMQGVFVDTDINAGDNGDIVQVSGVMQGGSIVGGDGNDSIITAAAMADVMLEGGDGSDQFQLDGAFKDVIVQLSTGDERREDGSDVVYIAETLTGDMSIYDRFHSSARYNGQYIEDDDAVVLSGAGWTERKEAGEAGNSLIRRSEDGKVSVRINLGSGDDDGEIEQIVILGEDGETEILRAELPDLMAKPFGVTVGAWAQLVVDVVLSAINPGFALVVAAKNMAMAAGRNDWMSFAASAIGIVGGISGMASATAGISSGTANTFQTISRIAGYAKDGIGVVSSVADGDISLTDILGAAGAVGSVVATELSLGAQRNARIGTDAAELGDIPTATLRFDTARDLAAAASVANRINRGIGYAEVAANSFSPIDGRFDPSALIQFGAGQAVNLLRQP